VACAFHFKQQSGRRNQLERSRYLIVRTKGIAPTVDEQRGRVELREVAGAQLRRFARRMQRVREQEKSCRNFWIRSGQHASLAAAIGMATEKDSSRRLLPQDLHGPAQTFTIAPNHGGKGRTVRARLAKRKIATQDHAACIGKSFGQGDQQFALAICARAVRKDKRIAAGLRGLMKKAAHRGFGGQVRKLAKHAH